MQDIYVNSNKGIVFKLVVSLEQGVIINKRKPSQIRVDLFQNFRFKFDNLVCFVAFSTKGSIKPITYIFIVLTLGTQSL